MTQSRTPRPRSPTWSRPASSATRRSAIPPGSRSPRRCEALCGLVGGPIWRIEPFHYAFKAGPGDLGGALGGRAPEDWAGAIEAALQAALGADSAWVNATDLMPDEAPAALDQPLLLLRAHGAAVAGALEPAGPGLQAVINARFATATARLAADAESRAAGRAAGALAAGQDGIRAALEAQAGLGAALARLTGRWRWCCSGSTPRPTCCTGTSPARTWWPAGWPSSTELAAGPAAFQETLGLTPGGVPGAAGAPGRGGAGAGAAVQLMRRPPPAASPSATACASCAPSGSPACARRHGDPGRRSRTSCAP